MTLRCMTLSHVVCSRRLTWRDLQHITVLTARQANLETDDWVVNGAGRMGMFMCPAVTMP